VAKKLQVLTAGDVFAVPLPSGDGVGVGQLISEEPGALNSVLCAIFDDLLGGEAQVEAFRPSRAHLLSVQLMTRDLLDSGKWKVCAHATPLDVSQLFPINDLRSKGYVGADVIGSRRIWELVAAYHGKSPWADFFDPLYLDGLLIPGRSRPAGAVLTKKGR
jgi:hypothetical protein